MRRFMTVCASVLLAALPGWGLSAARAAELPGGVGELLENHGDWVVGCRAQKSVVGCVVSQVQSDPKTRRPRLSAELQSRADGRIDGALLLPFGLALADGVTLKVDDAAPLERFSFSTCLPGGCLVPVRFDADAASALKRGALLHVLAVATGTGQPVPMRISLKGLPGALERARELAP